MTEVHSGEPHPIRARELAGLGFAALAALAFGTLAILAKFAFARGAATVPLLAGRFALAAVLLWAYDAVTHKGGRPPRSRLLGLLALGAFGYGLEASLFFLALEHAPAGTVALIFYSFPLWTTLLSILVGLETFRARLLVALALGTGGVSMIFSISAGSITGPLFALSAAVAVAIYFTLAQIVARGVPPATSALGTAAGAAVSLTVVAVVTGQGLPLAAVPHAAGLGLASALAFTAMFAAIDRIGSARASIAAMLEPVTTVALAAVFLDEAITARIAVGAVLVVSALPVLAASGRKQPSPPAADAL